jgi:hypothetical protein
MALMSLRGYARHRGVSLKAVQKAVQAGRIRLTPEGKIDREEADRDWERNTRAAARPVPVAMPAPARPEPELQSSAPPRSEAPGGALEYARARAVRETYEARLARLKYEEKLRKLLNADEVEVAAFNRFRGFRDRMLNIPDQLAPVLAAETDPRRVHELLAAAIRQALQESADAATHR